MGDATKRGGGDSRRSGSAGMGSQPGATGGILAFGADLRCLYANAAAGRALGFDAERVGGRSLDELGLSPLGPALRAAVAPGGGPQRGEARLMSAGRSRSFEYFITPPDTEGTQLVALDELREPNVSVPASGVEARPNPREIPTTERSLLRGELRARQAAHQERVRQLAEQQRNLAERLRAVVTHAPVLLFAWDRDGKFTLAEGAGLRGLGLQPGEVIGSSVFDVFRAQAEFLAGVHRALTGEKWSGRVAVQGRWFDTHLHPEVDSAGAVLGVTGICTDITPLVEAQEAIQRHNRALRTLSQGNQALVRARTEQELLETVCRVVVEEGGYRLCWVGYAEQDERHTVRPAAQAGYEQGYLDTVNITWADSARGRGPTGTAIRTRRPVVVQNYAADPEFAPWRAEALKRGYASGIALPLSSGDRVLGALMIYAAEPEAFGADEVKLLGELAEDLAFGITTLRLHAERERLQTQLMQADRMVSMGMLAAGVAHEINNPLAYVIANLDFARDELSAMAPTGPGEKVAEIRQALVEARDGAERVRLAVRDLKMFTRVDEESHTAVDLRRVLDSAINLATNEIKHRASLVREYGEIPLVEANEARLGQVFLNLLVNAAHAIPEGAADRNCIRVVTRTDAAGWAVVEIHDTGSGIAPELVGRIFDPFFTTKPIGVGTGLGLSICSGIISSLRGEMAVESQPGKGSLFRVRLQPAPPRAAVRASAAATTGGGRRGCVLVIDDEPIVGAAVRRLLAVEHEVTIVCQAREALERITRGERFDVILCDIMMPEMSGVDLHAAFAAVAPDQARRMVFMTGGAFTARAREFLEHVPNLRVDKPFDNQNLRTVVRSIVG